MVSFGSGVGFGVDVVGVGVGLWFGFGLGSGLRCFVLLCLFNLSIGLIKLTNNQLID